jgi:hypothetical protein
LLSNKDRDQIIEEIKELISTNDEPTFIEPSLLRYFDDEELISTRDTLLSKKIYLKEETIKWFDELYEKVKEE